jgi:phosphopantothenate-cysteine ligase
MHILLTSGGTKIPMDPVRDITNKSRGTFGRKIATTLLEDGHHVHFLHAKGSKTPFSLTFDLYGKQTDADYYENAARFLGLYQFTVNHKDRYYEYPYVNFDDYADQLEINVRHLKPEVTILAAAVSDYAVQPNDKKMRTVDEMSIALFRTEKLISKVKEWHPDTFLVGFKLLVGATEAELLQAANDSIRNNKCDIVVANDYNDIKAGNHRVMIVEPDGKYEWFQTDGDKTILDKIKKGMSS